MAGFDELIFNCLARDMDFRGTLAELYKSAGVWSALFDPSQHNSICVPEEGEERLEELERLRRGILDGFLTGDEKTAALLHGGESVIFEPGVSGGRTHVCRVASGHSESRSILSLAAGRRGVTQADDVYFELIVSGAVERVGKRVLELSEIAMLADYDEKNHTEYLATLEAYLNFGNRLSPAASSMFIDRSTMKYRLQKISDLLGSDIEQPDTAKRLAIGIAVHKVSG